MLLSLFLTPLALIADVESDFEITAYGSFYHFQGMPNALFFFDDIEEDDSFFMRKALRNHDIDTIILWSPGGSVFEGLQMAGIIYDRKLTVYVPNNGECLSACAFMFFGGDTKIAKGLLGVHQFSSSEEGSKKSAEVGETQMISQFTVSEIIGFLREFETPPFVYEKMFQQLEMYYFSRQELTRLEIKGENYNKEKLAGIDNFLERFDAYMSEKECDKDVKECTPEQLCARASENQSWSKSSENQKFVSEAKRQGLACNVIEVNATCISNPSACSDQELCSEVTMLNNGIKVWRTDETIKPYLFETNKRRLYCGISEQIPSTENLSIFVENKGFSVGDELRLTLTASQECRLTLINIDDDNDSCVLYPSKEFGDDLLQANSPLVFPPRGQLKFSEIGIEKIIAVCNFSDTAVRNELRATRPVSCYEEEQVLASKETRQKVILETLILDTDSEITTFEDIPNSSYSTQKQSGVLKATVEIEVK